MEEHLFFDISGSSFFGAKEAEIVGEINSLSEEELKNSDDSLKIILKSKHAIKQIEFGEYYQVDKGEVDINVRHYPGTVAYFRRDEDSTPVYRKGRRLEIHIPFSCDRALLKVKPSTWTTVLPRARISDNELVYTFDFISEMEKPDELRKKIDREITITKEYATWLNGDINSFNNGIDNKISIALQRRRLKLKQDKEFLEKIDIPKKKEEITQGFVRPENKLQLRIIKESPEKKIEASLELETYDEIIKYINYFGINLERASSRVRGLDEESLRDTFVAALNSAYEGMASAEAFNKEGKTDIILKYKDKSLYIAECKFWKGEKYFIEGIGQLLSYLTWRDSKTSYIIFSRTENVTRVIEKSNEILTKHPNFVSEDVKLSESSMRYKYRHSGDESRELYLTLHVFDLR